MKHVQVRLQAGTTTRTCWVPARVRAGNRITLKNAEDPHTLWDVTLAGTQERDLTEINRGWHNNI